MPKSDDSTAKPVQATQTKTPSTRASNPDEVRKERPAATAQSVKTPDGGNASKPVR